MAYTEFYCRSGGSNMNGGGLASGAEPSTSPVYSTTNGNWNGTSRFTPSDGTTPASSITVGDWAHVCADGSSTPTYIARVTAVAAGVNGAITLSTTAKVGSAPGSSATGMTIRVGGAWAGPNGASGFPFNFANSAMSNSSSNPTRVNFKNDQTYNITAGMTHTLSGVAYFQGYTSTPGDKGRATFDGGTSGTSYVLLTISSNGGVRNWFSDFIFQNNGATGSAAGISNSGDSRDMFHRITVHDVRGHGITGANRFYECEAYACNQSNTSNTAGFDVSGTVYRCYSHDNVGSNSNGFYTAATSSEFIGCISKGNGLHGFYANSPSMVRLTNCDSYLNGGDGYRHISGFSQYLVENCNFVANTGLGFNIASGSGYGQMNNCGIGSNVGGTVVTSFIDVTATVTYPSGYRPWVDAGNGDYRAIGLAKNSGVQKFPSAISATIGAPNLGAVQGLQRGILKTRTSIWSAQTLTAGAGNTTSSVLDTSQGYGAQVNIKITNGATGPTVPAQVQVQVANDYNAGSPTLWVNHGGPLVAGVANSEVGYWSVPIPPGVAAVRLVAGSNTGQNVTIDADISAIVAV